MDPLEKANEENDISASDTLHEDPPAPESSADESSSPAETVDVTIPAEETPAEESSPAPAAEAGADASRKKSTLAGRYQATAKASIWDNKKFKLGMMGGILLGIVVFSGLIGWTLWKRSHRKPAPVVAEDPRIVEANTLERDAEMTVIKLKQELETHNKTLIELEFVLDKKPLEEVQPLYDLARSSLARVDDALAKIDRAFDLRADAAENEESKKGWINAKQFDSLKKRIEQDGIRSSWAIASDKLKQRLEALGVKVEKPDGEKPADPANAGEKKPEEKQSGAEPADPKSEVAKVEPKVEGSKVEEPAPTPVAEKPVEVPNPEPKVDKPAPIPEPKGEETKGEPAPIGEKPVETPKVEEPKVEEAKSDPAPAPVAEKPVEVPNPEPKAEPPPVPTPVAEKPVETPLPEPKIEAPAPKAEEPKVEVPKVEEAKAGPVPAPRVEEPPRPEPKIEDPKAEPAPVAKVEEPTPAPAPVVEKPIEVPPPAPRVEEPVVKPEPKIEEPKVEVAKAEVKVEPPVPAPRPEHVEGAKPEPAPEARPVEVPPAPAPVFKRKKTDEELQLEKAHDLIIKTSKDFNLILEAIQKPPANQEGVDRLVQDMTQAYSNLTTAHQHYKTVRAKLNGNQFSYIDENIRRIETINGFLVEQIQVLKGTPPPAPEPVKPAEPKPPKPVEPAEPPKPAEPPVEPPKPDVAAKPAEPAPAEPKPAPAEPKPAEPTPAEPKPAEPTPAEPKPAEPAPAEPKPAEPKPAEPAPAEPKPAEPAPAEPKPAEPKPAEPAPAEPKPAEPAPAEPKPAEPAPAEPKPAEPKAETPVAPAGVAGNWVVDTEASLTETKQNPQYQKEAAQNPNVVAIVEHMIKSLEMKLSFQEDKTWTGSATMPGKTVTVKGTWTLEGDTLTLTKTEEDGQPKDAPAAETAKLKDGKIYLIDKSMTFVYHRP